MESEERWYQMDHVLVLFVSSVSIGLSGCGLAVVPSLFVLG
jgi:hypothetical protein